MQNISTQEDKISALARLADVEIQQSTEHSVENVRRLLEALNSPINRLQDQASAATKILEEARYQSLLRWLSPVDRL